MSIGEHSVMAGKSYRMRSGEICEVAAVEDDEVVYRAIASPAMSGMIVRSTEQRQPLATFAAEAEGEVDANGDNVSA
ncbi:MAG: hypothetical protein ACOY4R_28250 [Pseudomonadota bacterium]